MNSVKFNDDQLQVWNTVVSVEKALIKKDAAAFEQLLSPDFVGAIPTGASFGKAAYINHHCNSNFGVVALEEENINAALIRVYENTAVVNRRVHSHFKTPDGNLVEYDVQRMEVLVKINDTWQLVSGQGTRVIPVSRP